MLLPPGQYQIEVSAPGFATHHERLTHSESETRHQVQLEVIPDVGPEVAQTRSEATTEVSYSSAMEQERVPSDVSDAKQSLADAQPEPAQTPSDENLEAANATPVESEQVRRKVSNASRAVVTDLAVASDNQKIDTTGPSPSNCRDGAGGWTNCFELGELYYSGDGVPLDYPRAAEFYQQACDGEVALGCYRLGIMYYVGEGVPLDRARAARLYQQACAGDYGQGCYNLGILYDIGFGVRQNSARAAELYRQACNSGDALGCYSLGVSYANGSGVSRDYSRATEYYHRACNGDEMYGCAALTTHLLPWPRD